MDQQAKTIEVDGVHHPIDDLNDNQKYLLAQIEDLSKRVSSIQFQLDQVQVAKDFFTQNFIGSLKALDAKDD